MFKRRKKQEVDIDLGEGHKLRVELRRPVYTPVFNALLYFDGVFIGQVGVPDGEPVVYWRKSGTQYQQFFPMEVEK